MPNEESVQPKAMNPITPMERHGFFARVVMFVAGAVFAVAFCVLGAIMSAIAWSEAGLRGKLGALAAAALLFGIAAYGGHLAWRGLRGFSNPNQFGRFQRGAARYPRVRLVLFVVSLIGALAFLIMAEGPGGMVKLQRRQGRVAAASLMWWLWLGLAVTPIHVVVHEVGHALVGHLVGFRFVSVRIGPVCFSKGTGRWRLKWQSLGPAGLGGFMLGLAACIPDGDRMIRLRWALFTAGGVAANLLVAGLAWAVVIFAPTPASAMAALALGLLTGFALTGALLVVNLVPIQMSSGLRFDGAHIANALARSGPRAALFRIDIATARGDRPRNWGWQPDQLLGVAEGAARVGDELRVRALLIALDQGSSPACEAVRQHFLGRWGKLGRPLRSRVDYLLALRRALDGDATGARASLQDLARSNAAPGALGLLQAAIAVAEGDRAAARAGTEGWKGFLATSGLGPSARIGSEWAAEALDAWLRAQGPSRSPASGGTSPRGGGPSGS